MSGSLISTSLHLDAKTKNPPLVELPGAVSNLHTEASKNKVFMDFEQTGEQTKPVQALKRKREEIAAEQKKLSPPSESGYEQVQMLAKESEALPTLFVLVARGRQHLVEALLKCQPDLVLQKGRVKYSPHREFKDITPIQYAAWTLSAGVWKTLLRPLSKEAKETAALQVEELMEVGTTLGKISSSALPKDLDRLGSLSADLYLPRASSLLNTYFPVVLSNMVIDYLTENKEALSNFKADFVEWERQKKLGMAELKQEQDNQRLSDFLHYVVQGKQEEAEVMLKGRPELTLQRATIRDALEREFEQMTAFQYTIIALDHAMQEMLLQFMPVEVALTQLQELEENAVSCEEDLPGLKRKLLMAKSARTIEAQETPKPRAVAAISDEAALAEAEKHYVLAQYQAALPLFLQAARGNTRALLRLGYMYKQGLGVEKNFEEAWYWHNEVKPQFTSLVATAQGGDAQAQYDLALCYAYGAGIQLDFEQAVAWYRLSADQGYALAQSALGWSYHDGQGVESNEEEALKWYRLAAAQGNADAQSCLAWSYANGQGVARDEKKAAKWYHLAAEQGHTGSQCDLALCYERGQGVERNNKEAMKWHQEAANQGHAQAQYNLAASYRTGRSGVYDDKEAMKWHRLAADQGHAEAQYSLARRYAEGRGGVEDKEEAARLYQKAANQNHAYARSGLNGLLSVNPWLGSNPDAFLPVLNPSTQNTRGLYYARGQHGLIKDEKEAAKWHRLAAEQGHARAQYNLGVCYHHGGGVGKDEKEATKWYRLAAQQKQKKAQYKLGFFYSRGHVVLKDEKEAFKWYQKSARQGYARAQYQLGTCYKEGKGVVKNNKEAARWFKLSAGQGNPQAQCYLGVCYSTGQGVTKNPKQAAEWYRQSANKGDADGQCNLGIAYAKGQGVEKDEKEAVKWYQKAAAQGCTRARARLEDLLAVISFGTIADSAMEGFDNMENNGETIHETLGS